MAWCRSLGCEREIANESPITATGLCEQTAIKVGSQPMDMAFRGDELFVACQGDGSVPVIDIPYRRSFKSPDRPLKSNSPVERDGL